MDKMKIGRRTGLGLIMLCTLFAYSAQLQAQVFVLNNDKYSISYKSKGDNFRIKYEGKIEVNDTDTDIIRISRGGYFEVTSTTFGTRRSVFLEASGGEIRREYREGRRKTDYEPEGRKWLAEILPEIIRSTGIGAKSRVDRFYSKGGTNAVLEEVEKIRSDRVKAVYIDELMDKSNLSDTDLIKILDVVTDEIDSDYDLTRILKNHSDHLLSNEKTAQAYFEAVKDIDSDYYAMSILSSALDGHDVKGVALKKVLGACEQIGSDYYQSSVLNKLLDLSDLDDDVIGDLIVVSRDIGSDYYQTQVLSKALSKKDISSKVKEELIEAIADVSSDYYMSSVFSKVLEDEIDEGLEIKILDLVDDKMSSDYYSSVVLAKMIDKQDLEEQSVDEFVDAIGDIGSSTYAADVIKKAAQRDNLSNKTLIELIKACGKINSDYYKASALKSLARAVKESNNNAVKDAYRSAAKEISSDSYYGSAIRAID